MDFFFWEVKAEKHIGKLIRKNQNEKCLLAVEINYCHVNHESKESIRRAVRRKKLLT